MKPDWSTAPLWAQWAAMDTDVLGSRWFWYAEKPFYNKQLEFWLPSDGVMAPIGIELDQEFVSSLDPTQTLEQRP